MTTAEVKQVKQKMQKPESTQAMSPFEEMERMFDDYFSRGWLHPYRFERPSFPRASLPFEGKTPNVDVIDRENEIFVKAELPGVDKKDLDISVTQNSVTIKGTTSHEEKEEKGDYYRSEISRGSYSRSLSLPAEIDDNKAKAKFKDGVLELTLPKTKKSNRHTIKVE